MSRLRFTTAREVFETFPAALRLIRAQPTTERPIAFLSRLAQGAEPRDAISFCAFLLPRRETVWWAVQAVQSMQPESRQDAALQAAETWVRNPDDAARRNALAAAESADPEQPGTWTAWAAGYSGGSMVASHAVPCPPDLTAKTARIAVLTALARLPVRDRAPALQRCVEACIRLADDDGDKTRA